MMVTDLDLDDPGQVTCGWRSSRSGKAREAVFRVSGLVFVARISRL